MRGQRRNVERNERKHKKNDGIIESKSSLKKSIKSRGSDDDNIKEITRIAKKGTRKK